MSSVLFATPCYGNQVTREYLQSVITLTQTLNAVNLKHTFLFWGNESLITRARDGIARDFLSTDYEYLMFLDADIGFEVEDFRILWNLQVPMSVGCYRTKEDDSVFTCWRDGKQISLEGTEPFAVDYAGTGFMLIHRDVLEAVKPNTIEHLEGVPPKTTWGFFHETFKEIDGVKIRLSEDYAFCGRVKDAGFEILMDPKVKLRHVGTKVYT